jgi:hypothetical protein
MAVADPTAARPFPATATRAVVAAQAVLAVAAAASLLAAAIHAAVVPEHMMEWGEGNVPGWLPLAFAVSAALGLVWGVTAGRVGPTRAVLLTGLALNLLMVAAGVISRTVGLPGAEVEEVSAAWTVATLAEGIGVLACAWLLATPAARSRPRLRWPLVAGLTVAAVVVGAALVGPSEVLTHGRMLAVTFQPKGWLWGAANGALLLGLGRIRW